MREFEASGLWYLPPTSDKKVAGRIEFTRNRGLRLSLTGNFSEGFSNAREQYALISGIVSANPYGSFVTLIDCFPTRKTWGVPGFSTEDLYAHKALISKSILFEDPAELAFRGLSVQFDELSAWVGASNYSRTFETLDERVNISIHYAQPKRAPIATDPAVALISSVATNESVNEIQLREEHYFLIDDLPAEATIDKLIGSYVRPLQDFMTFVTGSPNLIASLQVFCSSADTGTERQAPSHVLYEQVYHPDPRSDRVNRKPRDHLIPISVFRERNDLLDRWFRFHARASHFCSAYFGLRYARTAYQETQFLQLLDALRILISSVHPPELSEEVGQVLASTREATSKMNDQVATLFELILPSTEEIAFPELLRRLMERMDAILQPLTRVNARDAVITILSIRRSISLHKNTLYDRADLGEFLLLWNTILELLITGTVLSELGFEDGWIARSLTSTRDYVFIKSMV